MAFQFQCPQCANVLQADESQAGQQSSCPMCTAWFVIPAPWTAPAMPPAPSAPYGGAAYPTEPAFSPPPPGFPGVELGAGDQGGMLPPQPPAPTFDLREPDLLHIPCPQCKKMLETPVEMLDQDVLCPHCQAQFQLRRRDSVEFKRKKEQEARIKESKAGKIWLNLAIVAVVLVVMFLGALIVWDVFGKA